MAQSRPEPGRALARILVVGDDAFVREVIRALLRELNHTVVVAEDGDDAFERLRSTPTDLVVSDNSVPSMSDSDTPDVRGPEVVTALRNEFPDLKILAVAGSTLDPGVARAVDAVLPKPFYRDEFLSEVRRLIAA